MNYIRFLILCLPLLIGSITHAQEEDQVQTAESDSSALHNRKRAALLSAIVPGSGQIYNEIGYRRIPKKKNRAWWKAPIIYGGLAATGYYFYENNKWAALIKKEYLFRQDNNGTLLDERFYPYSDEELIDGVTDVFPGFEQYARRRDYLAVGFVAVWGLNIIEAYVDAHFVTFNVSEDLTFSWQPTLLAGQQPGLQLRFDF